MKKKANPTPKQASPAKKRVQAPKLEPLDVPALQQGLLQLADESYRDFHAKLVPNIEKSSIIGVRVPMLRKFVRGFFRHKEDVSAFMALPSHDYYEENVIHAWLLSRMKDYRACLKELKAFLPRIDNWGVCDSLSPKVFAEHRDVLKKEIRHWIKSEHTYTIRFGVAMLMKHYLEEDFEEIYLKWVAGISSEEHYVNMMIAWYYATALAKQYDATIPYLEQKKLSPWVHGKTIQKAIESNRITKKQKEYLRTLRIKR